MALIPDPYRDLLAADFATLATVGKSGRPQQSIVWFLAEDGVVRLSFNDSRQKFINLQGNPSCSLLITDPKNAYRYIELRGRVEIDPDPDYTFADKLGAKYGSDLRERDLQGEKRYVVTLVVDRARGWGGTD